MRQAEQVKIADSGMGDSPHTEPNMAKQRVMREPNAPRLFGLRVVLAHRHVHI